MQMNNKSYDLVKWVALVVIPALGTLYFTLSETWILPYGTQVVATAMALELFLGALLGISTAQYNKSYDGSLLVGPEGPDEGLVTTSLEKPLSELAAQSEVRFKVEQLPADWDK